MRIENFTEFNVARIRHIGPYNEVGACFERLFNGSTPVPSMPGLAVSSCLYMMIPIQSLSVD